MAAASGSTGSQGTADPAVSLRFTVTIDGKSIGNFNTCSGLKVEVVMEQREEGGTNGFVWQLPSRVKYSNITLKRGYISQSAMLGLKAAGGRRVSIATAAPGARVTLLGARIERSRGQAKGTDVAMEELVLAHEGFG